MGYVGRLFKYDDHSPSVPLGGYHVFPYSPVSPLPYSYASPSAASRRFFHVAGSGFCAEVTQVNSISVSPIPPLDAAGALHEVVRCQSSQASQSIHYPRNLAQARGWRLLYLVAE